MNCDITDPNNRGAGTEGGGAVNAKKGKTFAPESPGDKAGSTFLFRGFLPGTRFRRGGAQLA